MSIITELAQQAKQAARTLAILDESQKNAVLTDMAAAIRANKDKIIAVNEKEVARAKENNLDAAMIDRLILDDERIESMAEGIEVNIIHEGGSSSEWDSLPQMVQNLQT